MSWCQEGQDVLKKGSCYCWWFRNPVNSPVEVSRFCHYLQGSFHPWWLFGISSINSMTRFFYPLDLQSDCTTTPFEKSRNGFGCRNSTKNWVKKNMILYFTRPELLDQFLLDHFPGFQSSYIFVRFLKSFFLGWSKSEWYSPIDLDFTKRFVPFVLHYIAFCYSYLFVPSFIHIF